MPLMQLYKKWKHTIAMNIIEDLKPPLIMMGFIKIIPFEYTDVYGNDTDKYSFSNNDGWSIHFHPKANFVNVLHKEDGFKQCIPLGKNTLKHIIKTIEKHNNGS